MPLLPAILTKNNTSYFVMDYVEGISFKTYIANCGGSVTVDDALNVMIPVLRALTAVPQRGLHPPGRKHLTIFTLPKDGLVKLLDFGLSPIQYRRQKQKFGCHPKSGLRPKGAIQSQKAVKVLIPMSTLVPPCFYASLTGFLPPESLERFGMRPADPSVPNWRGNSRIPR